MRWQICILLAVTVGCESGRGQQVSVPTAATTRSSLAAPTTAPSKPNTLYGHWELRSTGGDIPLEASLDFLPTQTGWFGKIYLRGWRTTLPFTSIEFAPSTDANCPVSLVCDFEKLKFGHGKLSFEGSLTGDRMTGRFSRGDFTQPVRLVRTSRQTEETFSRTPDTLSPQSFVERDVSFRSGGVTLAGTITLPANAERAPAAVLLSGSTATTRDYNGSFRTLARFLATKGIATLRCDDRGTGQSTGDFSKSTLRDLADDAVSALDVLRQQPGIAPDGCGLIGHSEGCWVAVLASQKSPAVRFVVNLSGAGISGAEVALAQMSRRYEKEGVPPDENRRRITAQRGLIRVARENRSPEDEERELKSLADAFMDGKNGDVAVEVMKSRLVTIRVPHMASFLAFDPSVWLRKLTVPVLAINGGADQLLDAQRNVAEIKAAIGQSKTPDATVLLWPLLDHRLQCMWAEPAFEGWGTLECCSPEISDYVASWIGSRFGREPAADNKRL